MKNTKELFIRLYTETLYSNFIVPLRGSNYIQLLYGDFKDLLDFLFIQTRWLVWQEYKNGLGQISGRIRAVFQIIPHNAASKMSSNVLKCPQKNVPEVSLKCYHQTTTEIPPELALKCGQKIGSIRIKSGQKIGVNRCKSVQKIGTDRDESGRNPSLKCDQMRPNATKKQGDRKRPKATSLTVTKSDQRCPENLLITYHYLILPNNLFMFCVGQKNI